MKILYVLTQAQDMGGASVHLLDLAAAMQTEGHEVLILAGGDGIFHERARALGLRSQAVPSLVRDIRPLQDIRALVALRRMMQQYQPDLVHLHSTKAGVLGRMAARLLAIPVVFTVHGWAFSEGVPAIKARVYRCIETLMAPLTQRIITVSDYDRQLALRLRVATAAQMAVVHNGIHHTAPLGTQSHNQHSPCSDGNAQGVPRLIMVARFEPPKRHEDLLWALAGMTSTPWRLELVGSGHQLQNMQELAASLGLSARVTFTGECLDVAARLVQADVFVLLSDWEGLPLSVLEAMQAGLPVLASNVGGVSEAVQAEETGMLVPRRDIPAIREGLQKLLSDADLRQRMGQAGRQAFEKEFTHPRMISKTLAVYRHLVPVR